MEKKNTAKIFIQLLKHPDRPKTHETFRQEIEGIEFKVHPNSCHQK